jgi:autotransporter strand-loop-strand O-heptosyltransferase
MSIYNNLKKTNTLVENKIFYHFVNGAFVEIKGGEQANYVVRFIDQNKQQLVYECPLSNNTWARPNIEYFVNWRVQILKGDNMIFDHMYSPEGKNVFISFDSSSLGDTLAYMPYTLEFKNKHNCNVIVCTYFNHLFEKAYPELTFVKPGEVVNDLYAMYTIGYFYNPNKEPILPNTIPLQKQACNILGLQYKELKPRIYHKAKKDLVKTKLVTIATASTSGCKVWPWEYWQEVINYLHFKGYTVVNISKEKDEFENCSNHPYDETFSSTIDALKRSEFFIGLASGLSWLAWAVETPVVMIGNFSEDGHEFQANVRITNTDVCHGCWNSHLYKFDKADWNWCPVHEGTNRQFECQTSITPDTVIKELYKVVKHFIP